MRVLYLILLIIAAVLFIAAAFIPASTVAGPHPAHRFNLVALGLLAWVLVPLIEQIDRFGD